MRKRNLLLISILFVLLIVGIFAHAIIMDLKDWREDATRYHCSYDVEVTGLSGREVNGTTVIMVPIPASKEGKFFTPYVQKDTRTQKLLHIFFNRSEPDRSGPYYHYQNMSEIFDNKKIIGNWMTFIAETDKGYMLGFRTNETSLEDIHFSGSFVADYFDIFDPINNGSPILFPIENISNNSTISYGDYTKYVSYPTYDTYAYISDNLKGGDTVSFDIQLDASNDATEWPKKYVGMYHNLLLAKVNDTGYVKVRAILGQELPIGSYSNYSTSSWSSQYVLNFHGNETSQAVNETSSYIEIA
ncbi:hypothetical protein ACSAZL_18355 [Methanosarcina sp. T3]|uniref:hypothetical protein n=1 Tax=Methanosarcina sp. T3 TaxID=3439062 RepID=UPI003F866DB4